MNGSVLSSGKTGVFINRTLVEFIPVRRGATRPLHSDLTLAAYRGIEESGNHLTVITTTGPAARLARRERGARLTPVQRGSLPRGGARHLDAGSGLPSAWLGTERQVQSLPLFRLAIYSHVELIASYPARHPLLSHDARMTVALAARMTVPQSLLVQPG
jgi:hypothetical protein